MKRSATFALAVLAPFFFITYSLAAWITSQRAGVGSVVFAWEHRIPFLPWTIIPYWSTDLFYAGALYLCRTRLELSTLVKRLIAAQVISIAGFLLFPLRFSFERPAVDGVFGWMFTMLGRFDGVYNQAPSLHLSIIVILWSVYGKRPLVRAWFVLMALSTLTTYQHHFIDVISGLAVGWFCVAMLPARLPVIYSAMSAMLVLIAWKSGWTIAWLLLWPAASLLIVAIIYATGRTELFGSRIFLAPYRAAAWINSRLWPGAFGAQEIREDLWIGRAPRRRERDSLGIASLVDVTAELRVNTRGAAVYRNVPMLDLVVPSVEQLEASIAAIDEASEHPPTLVFCALGYSRSAMAVAAWLIARGHAASVDDAVRMIRARRPGVALGPAHMMRLEEWRKSAVCLQN